MVNFDGFIVTHMIEPVLMPDREMVQGLLPPFEPLMRLDVDTRSHGTGRVSRTSITETKKVQQEILTNSYGPIVETLEEFGRHFKRNYKPVETYRAEDADSFCY